MPVCTYRRIAKFTIFGERGSILVYLTFSLFFFQSKFWKLVKLPCLTGFSGGWRNQTRVDTSVAWFRRNIQWRWSLAWEPPVFWSRVSGHRNAVLPSPGAKLRRLAENLAHNVSCMWACYFIFMISNVILDIIHKLQMFSICMLNDDVGVVSVIPDRRPQKGPGFSLPSREVEEAKKDEVIQVI